MIPQSSINTEFDIVMPATRTYRMTDRKTISGNTDGAEALSQSIYRILNTERYAYDIYSQNYGTELADLFGKSRDYAVSELKRRIADALSVDDRINTVDSFSFSFNKNNITCKFTIHSIYGDLQGERTVSI